QAAQGGEGQSRRVDRGDAQDQPGRRGGDQGQVGQQGREGQGGSGQRGCPDHHQVGPEGEGQGRVGDLPSQWAGGRPQGAGGRVRVDGGNRARRPTSSSRPRRTRLTSAWPSTCGRIAATCSRSCASRGWTPPTGGPSWPSASGSSCARSGAAAGPGRGRGRSRS